MKSSKGIWSSNYGREIELFKDKAKAEQEMRRLSQRDR